MFKQLRKRKKSMCCFAGFDFQECLPFQFSQRQKSFSISSVSNYSWKISNWETKAFLWEKKNERVFFNLSNIKQSFTLNGDNFKRKGCDSIISLRKPFFFLVRSCVNNLKVSNFQTKLFFAYKNCRQVPLCQDAAPDPGAKTWHE